MASKRNMLHNLMGWERDVVHLLDGNNEEELAALDNIVGELYSRVCIVTRKEWERTLKRLTILEDIVAELDNGDEEDDDDGDVDEELLDEDHLDEVVDGEPGSRGDVGEDRRRLPASGTNHVLQRTELGREVPSDGEQDGLRGGTPLASASRPVSYKPRMDRRRGT